MILSMHPASGTVDSTAPLHVQVDLMKRGHVANARADFKQAHALFRQAYEASGRIEARISAASMPSWATFKLSPAVGLASISNVR